MPEMSTMIVLFALSVTVLGIAKMRRTRGDAPMFHKKKDTMLTADDLAKKPGRVQRNSSKADLENLLVMLLRFTKKKNLRVVCPGSVQHEGRKCGATMLLVGEFGVQSIHCYGFGGSVSPADSGYDWEQTMNGETKVIMNPVQANTEDNSLLRQALDANGCKDVPVYSCGVFTQGDVQLNAGPTSGLYTSRQFKAWLDSGALAERGSRVADVQALTDLLANLAGIPEMKKKK